MDLLTIITDAVASVVEPLLDRPYTRRASALPALVSVLSDHHPDALALPVDARQQQQQRQQQTLLHQQQSEPQHQPHLLRHQQAQEEYQQHQVQLQAITSSHRRARWSAGGGGGGDQRSPPDAEGAGDYVFGFNDMDEEDNLRDFEPGRSCVDLLLRLLGGCGATEKRISALPVVALHMNAHGDVADDSILFDQDTCSICLDGYDVCNTVRVLGCHHVYHAVCIDIWLRRRPTCPVRD
jgi:hypothetical protein